MTTRWTQPEFCSYKNVKYTFLLLLHVCESFFLPCTSAANHNSPETPSTPPQNLHTHTHCTYAHIYTHTDVSEPLIPLLLNNLTGG